MPLTYAEVPTGVKNGINTVFTLANSPNPAISLQLFLNGILQDQGGDYSLVNATITFLGGSTLPQASDNLLAYYGSIPVPPPPPPASSGSFTELKGSDLVGMVQDRLGGYANALDESVLMDVINEGKDEIWAILKNLNQNYFQSSTRFDDVTQINYFGPLNPNEREYALPKDFRAVRFIEVVTSGFEDVEFIRRPMTSPAFRSARKASNLLNQANGILSFIYDIGEQNTGTPLVDSEIGKDTTIPTPVAQGGFEMVLAQFPTQPLQLVIWYLRALPDMENDTVLDNIIMPFSKKIANFAVEKCMKILQDLQMSEAWLKTWRQDVITVAQTGGAVDQADAQYVTDFQG